jgi:16S rRNA A1518/A1519 N6-dimethyltransferase RsmA/KsgA/DIM1 with predicted DNA glycosylase/AP lyase activity
MPILLDPEEHESDTLINLPIAWTGLSVLEIGSGDGRLTWRYADKAAHVTAIEPDTGKHETALAGRSDRFEHVKFLNLGLDEFTKQNKKKFDLALLSWSL